MTHTFPTSRSSVLFEDGYIKSIRAQIDPEKVGRGSLIFVGVVLDRSTLESFEAFEAAVRQIPMKLDCHLLAGDFDYFLKIRVDNMTDFNKRPKERREGTECVSTYRYRWTMHYKKKQQIQPKTK